MEDNYAEEVKSLSTSELKEIAINFLMYRGLLVAAAKNELAIRGIELTEEEKQQIEEVKNKRRQDAIKSMEDKNDTFYFDFKRDTNEEPFYKESQIQFQISPKEVNSFFDLFIPTKGYFIAPILLNINILVFILMVFNGINIFHPNVLLLQKWGANLRPLTLEGEWWRLLTSCFLHASIFHLIGNMSALIYIGLLLEPLLGRLRFISAYLLTGIIASLTSLCLHNMITSSGASGAIMGMYGVFLALLTTKLIELEKRNLLLLSTAVFLCINLIVGMTGRIDNAAHIGGLISGIIIGYSFIPGFKMPDTINLKLLPIGIMTLLVLSISFVEIKYLPSNYDIYKRLTQKRLSNQTSVSEVSKLPLSNLKDKSLNELLKRGIYNWDERKIIITKVENENVPIDIAKYDKKMKTFVSTEALALEVYNINGDAPKNKLLYALKEKGIYYWNENKKLIDEVEQLSLPIEIHKKNSQLKQYCELRIKSYELMYQTVDEGNTKHKTQLEYYNSQIGKLINEIAH